MRRRARGPKFSLVRPNGDMLAHWMYHRGLDPVRLAEKADVGLRTVYRVLNEESKVRISTLSKIAMALDVPPSILIRQEGDNHAA